MDNECVGLHERKCIQCGKIFEARKEYVYKIEDTHKTDKYYYFCSWKCMRQHERENIDWKKRKEITYQLNVGEKEDLYEPAV